MNRLAAACLLTVLELTSASVNAERSDADAAPPLPLLLRLAPTAQSVHAERTARLERRLVSALSNWPQVTRAEVLLDLPLAASAALDRPLPPARATVVLTHRGSGPTRADVFALLHASIPVLSAADLTLIEHAPAPTAVPSTGSRWVSLGPFRVAADSALGLRSALAVSFAIHALFAWIVLSRLRLRRALARKVDPRARTSSPP